MILPKTIAKLDLVRMSGLARSSSIDLNADLAEGSAFDLELLGVVTSANVCCGAHAGSTRLTFDTVAMAADKGVAIGAHPSYPDREGFGRRPYPGDERSLSDSLQTQLDLICMAAHKVGTSVAYLKPHGALYHDALQDGLAAEVLLRSALQYGLPLLHQRPSYAMEQAQLAGLSVFAEAFIDRGYDSAGRLLVRGAEGSVLNDPTQAATQAKQLLASPIAWPIASLCVHGDTPNALALASEVRLQLVAGGYTFRAFTSDSNS